MSGKNAPKAVQTNGTERVIESGVFNDVEVLTKVEASRFLKCGMSTLPKLGLPIIRMGRSVKYLKRDLETYLLENRQGGTNE